MHESECAQSATSRPYAGNARTRHLSGIVWLAGFILMCGAMNGAGQAPAGWVQVFEDPGTGNWQDLWFRDGSESTLTNTPEGLLFKTGPKEKKDASNEVLWTKQSFEGDLRIEYDFTRVDSNLEHLSVCILYFHAVGKGGPHAEDITQWAADRAVPTMARYFQGMRLYHISYACTGGDDNNYIRARQYPTKGNFAKDTLLEPGYENVDLFKPGETWHLVFEKAGPLLRMTATKGEERHEWKWDLAGRPELTKGRIGLRQMRDRESRIANFKVYQKSAP